MFYLGILYYFTGYYSNSVIIFYIIKTLILLSCGLPELDNTIDKDNPTTPTDFQESDYSIFNIFKSIELNIKYRKEYLEIQKKFPNVYLGLPKYISAVKKAEFYGSYTIRGILTYTDCVLIFILLGMSYSNTSTYYFVDNTILYGPGPFGSGEWKDLLEPYYKNDDENDNENQLGEPFKFVSGFYSLPYFADKKNPYLVRYDIDKGNELTKKFNFNAIIKPSWSYFSLQCFWVIILVVAVACFALFGETFAWQLLVYAILIIIRYFTLVVLFQYGDSYDVDYHLQESNVNFMAGMLGIFDLVLIVGLVIYFVVSMKIMMILLINPGYL